MKSSDFFRVQSNRIYFMQSGRDYSINVMKRTEVLIRPVLKKAGATVLRNGRACPQASKKAEAVSCVSLYNITAVIELFSEYTNIRTAYI